MEDTIRARFNPKFVQDAAKRFDINPDSIVEMEGFESYIYAGQRSNQKVALRLAHSIRRSPALIHGELDYMAHLARGGAAVSAPIASTSAAFVESIEDGQGGQFLASCFTWAHGKPPEPEHTDAFLHTYGQTLGQMHRLIQGYTPPQEAWRRPPWNDPLLLDVEGWLDGEQPDIVEAYRELREEAKALPTPPKSFNLIHQDMHMHNFHVAEDGQITVFDFDDCAYGFFINDLAIVLYHALGRTTIADRTAFTQNFLPPLLRGYRTEYALDPAWLRQLPLFLALRRVDLYAVLHRSMKEALLTEEKCQNWVKQRREAILQRKPFVDVDFMAFADSLSG